MVRLYVNPERLERLNYPYPMVNFFRGKKLDSLNSWEHAILDAGVETVFFAKRLKDYPSNYYHAYLRLTHYYTAKYGERVWCVIPDYPDDYEHGLTFEKDLDNVEKTFRNIDYFSKYEKVNWVYPLQSQYLDREGFYEAAIRLKKEYDPPRIGIGTVCKTKDIRFITYCCRMAREVFGPNVWIHAFGMTLKALPYARHYINSMDSSAFGFHLKFIPKYGLTHLNSRERCELLFSRWLERFNQIIRTPTLTQAINET